MINREYIEIARKNFLISEGALRLPKDCYIKTPLGKVKNALYKIDNSNNSYIGTVPEIRVYLKDFCDKEITRQAIYIAIETNGTVLGYNIKPTGQKRLTRLIYTAIKNSVNIKGTADRVAFKLGSTEKSVNDAYSKGRILKGWKLYREKVTEILEI